MRLPSLLHRSLTQGKYVLIGCVSLLFALQLVIVGQASAIAEQNSFGRVAELVPAFLQRGLGSRAMLLATFSGTVGFGYFHPIVLVLVCALAIYFATEPAHEVEVGLVDLELARAVPRRALITRSLAAAGVALASATVLMGAGTWLGLRTFASAAYGPPTWETVALLQVHLFALGAVFGSAGLAIAAGARRWSTACFTATLAAIVLYLVDLLSIGWPLMRSISWISPFRYYPALSILAGDAPTWSNLAVLSTIAIVLVLLAYWRFERRDL